MATYCYICEKCGNRTELTCPSARRPARRRCRCGANMRRDYHREQGHMRQGNLPDWKSRNAGVMPEQVDEANREYADLDVHFDSEGDAHVPGNNRKKFLKRRGLAEL